MTHETKRPGSVAALAEPVSNSQAQEIKNVHTNTTAASIAAMAAKRGMGRMKNVRVLSEVLAEVMHEIHGGSWSVEIDHERQFVAICQNDFGRGRITPPRKGVAI